MKVRINRSDDFKIRQNILRTCLISRRMMDYYLSKKIYVPKELLFDEEFFGYEEFNLLNDMFCDETSIPFDSRKHFYNFLHLYSALPNIHYTDWHYADGEELLPYKGANKWVYWSRFGGDMRYSEKYYDSPKNGILPHYYRLDISSFTNQVRAWIEDGQLFKGDPYSNMFDAFTNLIISLCFSNKPLMEELARKDIIDKKSIEIIYEEFDDLYTNKECKDFWEGYIIKYRKENF